MDCIKMEPTVPFPWEREAVARHPEQLVAGSGHRPEDAASAFLCSPDFPALARFGVGYADRPWRTGSLRSVLEFRSGRRDSDEGDLPAVWRPDRRLVHVHAWICETNRFRGHVIDADEGVISSLAYEG